MPRIRWEINSKLQNRILFFFSESLIDSIINQAVGCLNRELLLEIKKKKKWCHVCKQGQASQGDYSDVTHRHREKKGQSSVTVETGPKTKETF